MPVTARLSKLFYERLGEQIANELVDRLNAVDATYRADLRELNEQNFARFDAKLEQRIAELRAEFRAEIGMLRGEMRIDMQALRSEMHVAMHTLKVDLIKWMFALWAVSIITVVGGIATLARLVP
jgi:hypothetical protein